MPAGIIAETVAAGAFFRWIGLLGRFAKDEGLEVCAGFVMVGYIAAFICLAAGVFVASRSNDVLFVLLIGMALVHLAAMATCIRALLLLRRAMRYRTG
jgi:hypothetical protein